MRLSRIWRILQIKEGVIHRGRRPRWISASVDNTLLDLQNSSYPTKVEFNNCFIIHSKYFPIPRGVSPFRSLFSAHQNNTTLSPGFLGQRFNNLRRAVLLTSLIQHGEDFDVIGSIIFGRLYFWRHWFNVAKILSKFGEQQLVMVNFACGLNQSETGKYFEWIIILIYRTWPIDTCSNYFLVTSPKPKLFCHSPFQKW